MNYERMKWEEDEADFQEWQMKQPGYWADQAIQFVFTLAGLGIITTVFYGLYLLGKAVLG